MVRRELQAKYPAIVDARRPGFALRKDSVLNRMVQCMPRIGAFLNVAQTKGRDQNNAVPNDAKSGFALLLPYRRAASSFEGICPEVTFSLSTVPLNLEARQKNRTEKHARQS